MSKGKKVYYVLSIIKDNNYSTIGARISDGASETKIRTENLRYAYTKGVVFENAILTKDGYVKSKKGNLPIEIEGDLVLYHGSIGRLKGSLLVSYSSSLCDFGKGFYMGELKEQALNRICNSPNWYLYKIKMNLEDAKVYRFTDDIIWALYIAINREKIENFRKYKKLVRLKEYLDSFDILIGLIADDKIAESYERFLEGSITDKALIMCLKEVKYGNQVVIKSQKYCNKKYLKIVEKEIVSKEDRKNSLEWGITVKKDLNSKISEIIKRYRRDGKYIDEILEDYI